MLKNAANDCLGIESQGNSRLAANPAEKQR
jgi:hypothetical protein